jgi:beta-galactosidase GanA
MYIGAVGDSQLYDVLAKWLLRSAGVQENFTLPSGVELAQRLQMGKSFNFILNHNNSPQRIYLETPARNLLNQLELNGDVEVAPHDVLILVSETSEEKAVSFKG